MPSIFKEFPAPSVDNPALLAQYAHTLAEQYRQKFSAARGFAVRLEDKTSGRSRCWELRILHGRFGGTSVKLTPISNEPRVIQVEMGTTSRVKTGLREVATGLTLAIMIVLLLGALFGTHLRLGFALILLAPVLFVVTAVLMGIATLIGNALGGLDKALSDNARTMILKMAEQLPLPDKLQGPTPPPPMPIGQPIQANPRRSGIWRGFP